MEQQKHGIGYAKNCKRLHPNMHRNAIAQRVINALLSHKAVDIVFLSGSTALGGTDDYSDIDISAVVKNPQKIRQELLLLLDSIGKVTHCFTPPNLDNILVVFLSNLTKIDLGIYSRQEFQTKKWHIKGNISVIKGFIDTDERENVLMSNSKKEGIAYLAMALADLIAIPREIYRNNIYEARANLDDARRHIAIYVNLKNNDIYFNYNNFNNYLKKKQIDIFRKSLKNNDEYSGILESALSLLSIIKEMKEYRIGLIKTVEEYLIKQNRLISHPKLNL